MNNTTQGPMPPPKPSPHDFHAFDSILVWLQEWRNADHEGHLMLSRNTVVELIEGIKALRR